MIDLLRVHEVWTLGTYIKTQQPLFVSPVLGAREQKKVDFRVSLARQFQQTPGSGGCSVSQVVDVQA